MILENSEDKSKSPSKDKILILAKYFIDFKKYSEAWSVLTKEEKKSKNSNDYLLSLKIQRLKLKILPYYPKGDFKVIKKKHITASEKTSRGR